MITSSVLAQENPIKKAELTKGEKAPFSGFLLSKEALAKLLSDQKVEISKLKSEIEFLKKKHKEELDTVDKIHDIELEYEKKKREDLQASFVLKENVYTKAIDRTAKACEKRWFESPYFNFALGAIIAGGIATGVSYSTK